MVRSKGKWEEEGEVCVFAIVWCGGKKKGGPGRDSGCFRGKGGVKVIGIVRLGGRKGKKGIDDNPFFSRPRVCSNCSYLPNSPDGRGEKEEERTVRYAEVTRRSPGFLSRTTPGKGGGKKKKGR